MNTQSNVYTVIYASVMVIVVAAVLAFTALSLKPQQTKNIEIDKMTQILSSINIPSTATDAKDLYKKYIIESYAINAKGEKIPGVDAFNLVVAEEVKKPDDQRQLPVYVAAIETSRKYIFPMAGAGLWGPIWGYIALDNNGDTVYGAYFSHQGETPGLGAEIDRPTFSNQFKGKNFFFEGKFTPIRVEKKGQSSPVGAQVDAISGGTITSKGVQNMISSCMLPYVNFLNNLKQGGN